MSLPGATGEVKKNVDAKQFKYTSSKTEKFDRQRFKTRVSFFSVALRSTTMDYGEAISLYFWGWGRSSNNFLAIFRESQPASKKKKVLFFLIIAVKATHSKNVCKTEC